MHHELIEVNFDKFISVVVYACLSSTKVTKLGPYIDDDLEAIVVNIVIVIGVDVTNGDIE